MNPLLRILAIPAAGPWSVAILAVLKEEKAENAGMVLAYASSRGIP
jgi:hypothetical protein